MTCCWYSSMRRTLKENFPTGVRQGLRGVYRVQNIPFLLPSVTMYPPLWVQLDNRTTSKTVMWMCSCCRQSPSFILCSVQSGICTQFYWLGTTRCGCTDCVRGGFFCLSQSKSAPQNTSTVWMTSMHQISEISIVLYIMSSAVTQHAVTQSGDSIISLMRCVFSSVSYPDHLCLSLYLRLCPFLNLPFFLLSAAWHKRKNSNAWRTSTRTPWNLHQGRARARGPRMKPKARLLRGRSGLVSSTSSCPWPVALSD